MGEYHTEGRPFIETVDTVVTAPTPSGVYYNMALWGDDLDAITDAQGRIDTGKLLAEWHYEKAVVKELRTAMGRMSLLLGVTIGLLLGCILFFGVLR